MKIKNKKLEEEKFYLKKETYQKYTNIIDNKKEIKEYIKENKNKEINKKLFFNDIILLKKEYNNKFYKKTYIIEKNDKIITDNELFKKLKNRHCRIINKINFLFKKANQSKNDYHFINLMIKIYSQFNKIVY